MFTNRFNFSLKPNRWTRILKSVRDDGNELIDLAISNPTKAGFCWDESDLGNAILNPEPLNPGLNAYSPSPRGPLAARAAIAEFYRATHDVPAVPEQIHLTASTSEAYSWLLKLLTNPGENVLVPAPSYPLISFLCAMEAVETRDYFLRFSRERNRWELDFDSLAAACDEKTRAIFVVSPNNPTGNVLSAAERERLFAFAQERNLPIICDEVFLEYPEGTQNYESLAKSHFTLHSSLFTPLTFILGGLSKTAALPQIKAGWILTCGDENLRSRALARLDFIADTFLSISVPAARAVPALLKNSEKIRAKIRSRLDENFALLSDWVSRSRDGRRLLPCEAGWYAILELPRGIDEESLVIDLLHHGHVLVHPGYFYDLDYVPADSENSECSENFVPANPAPHLVFSLLAPPENFLLAFPHINAAILRH